MKVPAHVYAFAISLVGLVGMIVLAALRDPVPSFLQIVTVAALAAGAGIALPTTPPTA